jgi:endonuclease YncB( thermonuclease family)
MPEDHISPRQRRLRTGWLIWGLLTTVWLGLAGCRVENRLSDPYGTEHNRNTTPVLKLGETPKVGTVAAVKVTKVFDGDTFEFQHEGQHYSVRLSGIDAPERTQDFADQARQALRHWTASQFVRIDVLKIDNYKRLVSKVQLESGQYSGDVSLRLLEQGLAWHFKRYVKDQPVEDRQSYAIAEEKARAANLGLWTNPNPLAPWIFREQQRAAKSKGLVPG